jgi:hypothetical protein
LYSIGAKSVCGRRHELHFLFYMLQQRVRHPGAQPNLDDLLQVYQAIQVPNEQFLPLPATAAALTVPRMQSSSISALRELLWEQQQSVGQRYQ